MESENDINPEDSVSQISRTSRGSVTSLRLKQEQKNAELLERQKFILRKQKLERERLNLQQKEELLNIEEEIAVANAKTQVVLDISNEETLVTRSVANSDSELNSNIRSPTNTQEQKHFSELNDNIHIRTPAYMQGQQPVSEFNNTDIQPLQTSFTTEIVQHLRRPAIEIKKFGGNPIEFPQFMRQFRTKVVSCTANDDERLNYLEQYTYGQPNKIVCGYSYLEACIAYPTALKELEERYGDPNIIANAFVKRALDWPTIKSDNPHSLDEFGIFLTECLNAIRGIDAIRVLQYPDNMKKLIRKLPYHLHDRWRNVVQKHRNNGDDVNFKHLVDFVKLEGKKSTDPLYGKDALFDTCNSRKESTKKSNSSYINNSSRAFTTQTKSNFNSTLEPKAKLCEYCNGNHQLKDCQSLYKLSQEEKLAAIKNLSLCFACLQPGHYSPACRNRLLCTQCKRYHPSVLHIDYANTPSKTAAYVTTHGSYTRAGEANSSLVTMPIIPVKVTTTDGLVIVDTYAFMDPGSSVCFITNSLMKRLGIFAPKSPLNIETMTGSDFISSSLVKNLEIFNPDLSDKVCIPTCYSKDSIPVTRQHIPVKSDIKRWTHLSDINISDLPKKVDIGLLIGNNIAEAYTPFDIKVGPKGSPYASRSALGWILWNVVREIGSPCNVVQVNRIEAKMISEAEYLKSLDLLVRRSFDFDFPESIINDKTERSIEDNLFIQKVENTISFKDGHYEVALPLKDDNLSLPDNYVQVYNRLISLKKKMEKNEKFRHDYVSFMTNLIENGYAERIPEVEINTNNVVWYVPHHGVYHKRKNKLRTVFDCSAHQDGISLNDVLLQGPDLANSLIGVLLRFRFGRYAFMSDIEAMFHQVKIPKDDRDKLRFLWWPDGSWDNQPASYRMTAYLFGAVSSPSIANFSLKRTALDNKDDFDNETIETLLNDFYVDDCLHALDDEHSAIRLIRELMELCKRGGFRLHKWICNSPSIFTTIPESERANDNLFMLGETEDVIERALGVYWNVSSDSLTFKVNFQDQPNTRRGLLSILSSVFDPLGLASPGILPAKRLMQTLCTNGCTWDQPIGGGLLIKWREWIENLRLLEGLEVPRCLKPTNFGQVISRQLHYFADASDIGYGIACYMRFVDLFGNISCSLLLGKSRVAPIKQQTIPRMELTAATVAVKISLKMKQELNVPIDKTYFWTDSTTVLGYISNRTTRFKTFVSNRISLIQEATDFSQWRHVSSKLNPADYASRGLTFDKLIGQKTWFDGPEFLKKPEADWPDQVNKFQIAEDDVNVKVNIYATIETIQEERPLDKLIQHYSDYNKLIRAVAWWKLYIRHFRKDTLSGRNLNLDDINDAEMVIIKHEQFKAWNIDMNKTKDNQNLNINSLKKLDPDVLDGLVRVGGRLSKADIPFNSKHQIIIPKTSKLASLIIRKAHKMVGHLGKNAVLSEIRKTYWIVGCSTLIKQILSECVICRRYKAQTLNQKMADLPIERIEPFHKPFYHSGMDYLGPFEIKRGRSVVKRYGVIFTCFNSRAVHLEVADTLDTDSCVNAIRRFVARRGHVHSIRSDNGTNLVGAAADLKKSILELNNNKIAGELLQRGIQWYFNPPSASHFGGAWERLIREVRKVLYSLQHEQLSRMDYEGFRTLFCEIESILNKRPITKHSDSIDDLDCLSPNHLLGLGDNSEYSITVSNKTDNYVKRRWKQVQYLSDIFWKRWVQEYLPNLQERQKWLKPKANVNIGDIVLLVEGTVRNSWALGRVTDVTFDKRGFVRIVTLKTKTATLSRPVHKLCTILEADKS